MQEMEGNLTPVPIPMGEGSQEVNYLVSAIAGYYHEFRYASLLHGSDGALQQGASTHLQQTLGFCVSQWAKAFCHSGG
jgi:hypothetical protein